MLPEVENKLKLLKVISDFPVMDFLNKLPE